MVICITNVLGDLEGLKARGRAVLMVMDIGLFLTPQEAAKKYHRKFACLNKNI